MTLSSALDTARAGLSTSAGQISVTSRNVARIDDKSASRKIANPITDALGGVRLAVITRASSDALSRELLSANSAFSQQTEVASALKALSATVGDPQDGQSPAALIGKLSQALQTYASAPEQDSQAQAAVEAARNVAVALNSATANVQGARAQADAGIAASVASINDLLSKFGEANNAVVRGTQSGIDVTDDLDKRDGILLALSTEIGIKAVGRPDSSIAIYTDAGVTLFDRTARTVSFGPTPIYTAATTGKPVYADGVPITTEAAVLPVYSGKLAGLSAIRDGLSVTYQTQLDEIARGLIASFAEKDQSVTPTLPDAAGLFTYAGAPLIPAAGVAVKGIAASIRVAASVDTAQGGRPTLLRDGGISSSGAAPYVYNTTAAAGYSARLRDLSDRLVQAQSFDGAARLSATADVATFAASSASYLEDARKTASASLDYRNTLKQKASDALSNETGINLDSELSALLALERSYQASAKLISAVDALYQSLFDAVR